MPQQIEKREYGSIHGDFDQAILKAREDPKKAIENLEEQLKYLAQNLPKTENDEELLPFVDGIFIYYVKFWARSFVSETHLDHAISQCSQYLATITEWRDPVKRDIRKILEAIADIYLKQTDETFDLFKCLKFQLISLFLDPTDLNIFHDTADTLKLLKQEFDGIILLQYAVIKGIANNDTIKKINNLYQIKKIV
ncbi:MAG: hypothetical protein G01um101418_219 [Parcubacteria group bacterium Gr01-1014_18]|nr:MAG: hypothetical protein Greene041636_187 [Parcubacteria group bacterium Greene0416_36]TSC81379.1 MAG: hypothetical protein G01um101418_219 [Parcubacteria group bacterium Gr01-1014_18]TSC99435.1 MAG: hypothetical protein Greene101420_102 [Parcubacteria group bacterium Greene1014_20]TSD07646.1 MAG: hypothetical protein Greene07142_103 [Parcubacteria group bacterium Greene0714_2]